jgi:hypothetical protein
MLMSPEYGRMSKLMHGHESLIASMQRVVFSFVRLVLHCDTSVNRSYGMWDDVRRLTLFPMDGFHCRPLIRSSKA